MAVGSMCQLQFPGVTDCASWCCVNRGWYVFFMVLFFGVGSFALCSAYYLYRLHQINVAAGVVTETGEEVVAPQVAEEPPLVVRKKNEAVLDPRIIKNLEEAAET